MPTQQGFSGAWGYYWDNETGNYYVRSRMYSPEIGRFLTADTHWNVGNMVYGDNPVKWNDRGADGKDPLGLNTYTYKPDINAIMQSGNLYAYCMGNPIYYQDPSGCLVWPGEIHDYVQTVLSYGLTIKNSLDAGYPVFVIKNAMVIYPGKNRLNFGGIGFVDLWCPDTQEAWEIKPDKAEYYPGGSKSGLPQLQKYIKALGGGAHAGRDFGMFTFYYTNVLSTYKVDVRCNTGNGMIYYSYDKVYDVTGWALVAAVGALLAYFGLDPGMAKQLVPA